MIYSLPLFSTKSEFSLSLKSWSWYVVDLFTIYHTNDVFIFIIATLRLYCLYLDIIITIATRVWCPGVSQNYLPWLFTSCSVLSKIFPKHVVVYCCSFMKNLKNSLKAGFKGNILTVEVLLIKLKK